MGTALKLLSKPVGPPKVRLSSIKVARDQVVSRTIGTGRALRSSAAQLTSASSTFAKKLALSVPGRSERLQPYRKNLWVAPAILLAVAVPQVSLLWQPMLGAYATSTALILLLALALRLQKVRQLALSAAIIPTAMLISLGVQQQDAFARSAEFYDVILFLALIYGDMFSITKARGVLSLKKKYLVLLPLMVMVGQVLGAVGFGMVHGQYPYTEAPLALVAGSAVIFGIAEELLFRGLIQHQALKVVHPVVAAVIASLAYAVVFAVHGSIMPFAFSVIAGGVLSGIYCFKQNLLLTTVANVAMKLVFVGLMATFILR